MEKKKLTLKDIQDLKSKHTFSGIPYFDATGRSVLIFPIGKDNALTGGLLGLKSPDSRDGGVEECLIIISASDPKTGSEVSYSYIGYAAHNPASDVEFDFSRYADFIGDEYSKGAKDLSGFVCYMIPYEMVRSAYLLLGKTTK